MTKEQALQRISELEKEMDLRNESSERFRRDITAMLDPYKRDGTYSWYQISCEIGKLLGTKKSHLVDGHMDMIENRLNILEDRFEKSCPLLNSKAA